jgi:ATP-dependent helicase/nuclease subunit A
MKTIMTNTPLNDQQDRERALDPHTSFIVQAPAGSGKTELLTQRVLVLLGQVKAPEEILAITFTKKSANEMRARIINTLKKAWLSEAPPEQHHALKTWELAKKVLKRDQQLQWNILANPNRLRIQTIDSFNSSLTRYLPILSQFGSTPEIADEPTLLYTEAAQELLTYLEKDTEWANDIARLLLHFDNDINKVQTLLIAMLAKRDQWLRYFARQTDNIELRQKLESSLQHTITDALIRLENIFLHEIKNSSFVKDELISLLKFSAMNLLAENSQSFITKCADVNTLPETTIHDYAAWLGVAEFLLKKDHQWRKSYTVREGFPAPGKNLLLKENKERVNALINELSQYEDLRVALEELRFLPTQHYADSQWEIFEALHTVLTLAAAQLRVTFQTYGKIDYIENAQAALTALGSDDAPTDIALALDYRIQHILVDEFQDTASTQYSLLTKLIAGWEPNDGRTLFVVGDPMQSIYRFREAEVGLFIRARKHGLGNIPLVPLTLSVNFRSSADIVDWVNQKFKIVFPAFEDIATGAVSYSESSPHNILRKNRNEQRHEVQLHPFLNTHAQQTQANKIIELIQNIQQENPEGTIAILVRTRSHLKYIIPTLKAAKLPYRAIKIDPLDSRPIIQDLMALTRALMHPADRIAWLALLRAPWCGLTLNDLLQLTGKDQNNSLWKQLQLTENISKLSWDGQKRLERILPILKEKISERRRLPLRLWIESTWITLGGPACAEQESDLEDASAYFGLLEKLDNNGDLIHFDTLNEMIKQLFAAPDGQADERLQIMTIHNAKGLEFDTVILPHLEKKASHDDKQLLLWMERPREEDSTDLIISPVNAIGDGNDKIYDYIKNQQKIKSQYENCRLLYVAVTRAKKNLHLIFSLEQDEDKEITEIKPASNSLLDKLWPAIQHEVIEKIYQEKNDFIKLNQMEDKNPISIKRLVSEWQNPIQILVLEASGFHNKSAGFLLPDNKPKIIGTLMHRILQQLANHGASWWLDKNAIQKNNYLNTHLTRLGILKHELQDAISILNLGIENVFKDPKAQWILHSHAEAYSEFAITASINNEVTQLVLDRTFIDETGTLWIIDYKTSILSDEDLEEFLRNEKEKYEKKLWEYHQAMRQLKSHPIRVALYFPMIPAWKEWSFAEPINAKL